MNDQQRVADEGTNELFCDAYGHEWNHADCDECGSPECYVYCDCGEEERQCEDES